MWPDIPEWADAADLDPEVRRDLRGLSKEGAAFVGGHLIAAGTLADEDPDTAWLHARAARAKGGRIAVVRETAGLVAYRAEQWSEAISELRAARRMGGGAGHIPVLADCERALGHPETAIELSRSQEAAGLDADAQVELAIVAAGARADLGQLEVGLIALAPVVNATDPTRVGGARLFFAYADLLARAGRRAEAIEWFVKASDADVEDETDADLRLTEMASGTDDDVAAPAPQASGSGARGSEARATSGDTDTPGTAPVEIDADADGADVVDARQPQSVDADRTTDDREPIDSDEPVGPDGTVGSDEPVDSEEPTDEPIGPDGTVDPDEQDEPVDPDEPVGPDGNVDSEEPTDPDEQDEQDEPVGPDGTVDPDEPVHPEEPTPPPADRAQPAARSDSLFSHGPGAS